MDKYDIFLNEKKQFWAFVLNGGHIIALSSEKDSEKFRRDMRDVIIEEHGFTNKKALDDFLAKRPTS